MRSSTSQPIPGSTFTPGPHNSPAPPKKAGSGDCFSDTNPEPSSEVVTEQGLTTSDNSDDPPKIHHGDHRDGDLENGASQSPKQSADDDVTPTTATTCDDSGEPPEPADDAPASAATVNALVNVESAAMVVAEDETEEEQVARMELAMANAYASLGLEYQTPEYQTPEQQREQAVQNTQERFLMCLEMGLSMRQAARAVGRHHTTFVKRAKRDEQFAASISRARQRARTGPLQSIYEASHKSWRAAAWLLNYMDRKESQGGGAKRSGGS